jgi:hypothetical protein
VAWTEQELIDLAEHLGLESVRGGGMELVLRAKSGNEARIWSSEDMGVEFGTPTCPCSEAHCSCGWAGPERVSHGSALRDAEEHVEATGHLSQGESQ